MMETYERRYEQRAGHAADSRYGLTAHGSCVPGRRIGWPTASGTAWLLYELIRPRKNARSGCLQSSVHGLLLPDIISLPHTRVQRVPLQSLCANSGEMAAHGVRLGLVLGPSLIKDVLKFPFPMVHVDSPEGIAEAVAALFEFGVELPGV